MEAGGLIHERILFIEYILSSFFVISLLVDSLFPDSKSAVFLAGSRIPCTRISIPVATYAPMEVRGWEIHSFSISRYKLYSFVRCEILSVPIISPPDFRRILLGSGTCEMSPDARSGCSMRSNGNKGVEEVSFQVPSRDPLWPTCLCEELFHAFEGRSQVLPRDRVGAPEVIRPRLPEDGSGDDCHLLLGEEPFGELLV
jgi:hypothetical protein